MTAKRGIGRHESIADKIQRHRGLLLVISVPIVLISLVLLLMPGRSTSDSVVEEYTVHNRKGGPNSRAPKNYAVIFDAGSSGSRVAEKINLIEQYKTERQRQQKLAEEEEIRRLRKELVRKAQPMPFFDRPFIPKRSNKHPTIPRDPKFNIPQHKKIRCCSTSSWSDNGSYMSDLLYQQDL